MEPTARPRVAPPGAALLVLLPLLAATACALTVRP